ncbi:MAG: ABC transporter permease [Jatrophihabitans sp.]|uniref:ABC transporter permease n=1 Tax=Jatrophihabitans sp. TaxID=1932789 RepID=UPI003F812314
MSSDVRLGLGLVLLLLIGCGALTFAGVHVRGAVVYAAARASLQLTVVALALRGVFAAPWAVVGVLALMYSVVVWTGSRRLTGLDDAPRAVAIACAAGAVVAIGIIVGLPTLSRDVRTLVAASGIVLGGTMTAATLTGRRIQQGVRDRRAELEGWLALGATMREAVRPIARDAVREALIPALDQTRTVGLVTLPGAFVGALLGGAGAAQAARFQIVVLIGLLCAEAITATVLAHLLGAPAHLPAEEAEVTERLRGRRRGAARARRPARPQRAARR